MSRPVDSRLNRSGYGQLSETDQLPTPGATDLDERNPARSSVPAEQQPGFDHDNHDTPDHVHPALAIQEGS